MQKWGFFSLPFLLPIANHVVKLLPTSSPGSSHFRHIGKREDPGDETSEDAIILVSTKNNKMAARVLHRVCCSAGYCQVSRHVSSLFRLQMTNTLLKHNKGFQIFYRGFFVSKGLWRSLHGIKNKQRGYKLMWQHHEYKFKKINTPTLNLAFLLTMRIHIIQYIRKPIRKFKRFLNISTLSTVD